MTTIVLLSGYAGSGKDSVRRILEQRHGFLGMAFADGVREEAIRENRLLQPGNTRYLELLEREGGYEQAKRNYPSVRAYLVDIGHGYRQKFGRDYWINKVKARVDALNHGARVCISDCRYANERFRSDAQVWYIERPGVGPNNETEAASIKEIVPDHIILNDGTLQDLESRVAEVINKAICH